MNNNKTMDNHSNKHEPHDMEQADIAQVNQQIEDIEAESPFNYFETNQIDVQLSSGDFQYEATDFVLPGKNGFDVVITRRYETGCANLVDMDPSIDKKVENW